MVELTFEEKKDKVEQLKSLLDKYPVAGVLDMHGLPAKQLQEIKKELKGIAEIKMSRKTLLYRALNESEKEDLEKLEEVESIQPALIFSNQGPFRLFQKIKAKKTSAPAKEGAIATKNIEIEEGSTGLPPGPMIGKIQSLGAQTKVQDGEIVVQKGSVAVKEGETISSDEAEILNNLGMEPLEVGLDLKAVWADGDIYNKNILDIEPEEYKSELENAVVKARNLAMNAKYPTEDNIVPMIQESFNKARNLVVNAEIPTKEFIDELLSSAIAKAKSLESESKNNEGE